MSKTVAILDNDNKVINIIIVNDNYELNANEIFYDKQTVYINGDYIDGYFYAPQPYPSWIRSEGSWQAPTAMPTEGRWYWDENTLSWIELEA